MFCSHCNLNDGYKNNLVNDIEIYSSKDGIYHCQTYFGILQSVIEVSNPRDDVYEKFKSLKNYKKYIDNETPAENLAGLDPSEIKDFDNYSNLICDEKLRMMNRKEMEEIKSGRTLLRVNDENQVIYTVSKVGDRFIFRNFSLADDYPGSGYSLRLFLNSAWYVKQLPHIKDFKKVIPYCTTVDDIMKIDPSFRCCLKNGVLYSTHYFASKINNAITIKYYKNFQGIYKVESVTGCTEGYNLLPYLLPIDRKLIDPNYNSDDKEEPNPQLISNDAFQPPKMFYSICKLNKLENKCN